MCQSLFFKKVCNFTKKETLSQVFSCEFSEISKNTFSYTTRPMVASGLLLCPQSNDLFTDSFPAFIFFQRDIVNCERKLSNRHKNYVAEERGTEKKNLFP